MFWSAIFSVLASLPGTPAAATLPDAPPVAERPAAAVRTVVPAELPEAVSGSPIPFEAGSLARGAGALNGSLRRSLSHADPARAVGQPAQESFAVSGSRAPGVHPEAALSVYSGFEKTNVPVAVVVDAEVWPVSTSTNSSAIDAAVDLTAGEGAGLTAANVISVPAIEQYTGIHSGHFRFNGVEECRPGNRSGQQVQDRLCYRVQIRSAACQTSASATAIAQSGRIMPRDTRSELPGDSKENSLNNSVIPNHPEAKQSCGGATAGRQVHTPHLFRQATTLHRVVQLRDNRRSESVSVRQLSA